LANPRFKYLIIASAMKHLVDHSEDIKEFLHDKDSLAVMYIGNLESYQGIDLLLQSFKQAVDQGIRADLFIIGGEKEDIANYLNVSQNMGIGSRVHFLGPRPVKLLSYYLNQADILVSPRIKGKNTPMKIYSYLGSGKAVLATNLETHTQVLTDDVAMLVDPQPESFAHGLLELSHDSLLRQQLGHSGQQMILENFSIDAFTKRANGLLDWVQCKLNESISSAPS
jgi:glycosyltransferase involved in cell wall biosynthesis